MTHLDWAVVLGVIAVTMVAGVAVVRLSSRHGAVSYFTSDRNLPWWAIAISNTATYQSGTGGFVMLVLTYGLAANWLWWSSWIVWMPLVAVVWAPLWRRMQIITTAELITLRYGGRPARVARQAYAVVCCFGFSVLLIGYITGFFAKTIAPVVQMSEWQILLLFGATTALYTMFGGLLGVVVTEVLHFVILMAGSTLFMFIAVAQQGGWSQLLARIAAVRPEALAQIPPVTTPAPENSIALLTIVVLALQGVFFAGSPTAGEGSTAQRFMAARSERHAMAGQLLNCFLALCLRILPLIGIGLVALAVFWPASLARSVPPPAGMTVLDDPVSAWGELINRCRLPAGLTGLLIAVEVAAYTSTLSALINWGSSFVINDLYRPLAPDASVQRQIWVSRATTLVLFLASSVVALLFVKQMVGWFMFINSAMVIFLLPLSFFRFFWWRFNVWGELAAIVLGLAALDPRLVRPRLPKRRQTSDVAGTRPVVRTQLRCPGRSRAADASRVNRDLATVLRSLSPPGWWGPVRAASGAPRTGPSTARLVADSVLGTLACLGLVLAANALFVGDWLRLAVGCAAAVAFGAWLVQRVFAPDLAPANPSPGETPQKQQPT